MASKSETTIPGMIPDELHHAFGRALRILHAFAKANVRIDGEELPSLFLSDVANSSDHRDIERLYADYPRDWSLVYPKD